MGGTLLAAVVRISVEFRPGLRWRFCRNWTNDSIWKLCVPGGCSLFTL